MRHGLPDHNVIVRVHCGEELMQVRPRQLVWVLCTDAPSGQQPDTRQIP